MAGAAVDLLNDDDEHAAWLAEFERDGHGRAAGRLRRMAVVAWLPVGVLVLLALAAAVTIVTGVD